MLAEHCSYRGDTQAQHDFTYLHFMVCTADQSKHYNALVQMPPNLKGNAQFLPCMSASLALNLAWVSLCIVVGEDDDDLYEALARARRTAEKQQKQGANLQDTLAEQLASRRDQDEAHQAMDTDTDLPAGRPPSSPSVAIAHPTFTAWGSTCLL